MRTPSYAIGLLGLFFLSGGVCPSSAQDDLIGLIPERFREPVLVALSSPEGAELRSGFRSLDPGERTSWAFLVARMPPARRKRLTGTGIAEHVRAAHRARREQPWAKDLPDDLFLHWVLTPLADGQISSPRRPKLYETLVARLAKRRVDTAEKAALEVNRFCTEETPEGALRNRLFVHAARAIGLPARGDLHVSSRARRPPTPPGLDQSPTGEDRPEGRLRERGW